MLWIIFLTQDDDVKYEKDRKRKKNDKNDGRRCNKVLSLD